MHATIANAVKDFAKTMGMANISIPESGVLQFFFERAGNFLVEEKEEGAVFYLMREVPEHSLADKLNKALRLCHYKESHSFDVQTALFEGNHLIFLVWSPYIEATGPKIESILQHLVKLHDKLEEAY